MRVTGHSRRDMKALDRETGMMEEARVQEKGPWGCPLGFPCRCFGFVSKQVWEP